MIVIFFHVLCFSMLGTVLVNVRCLGASQAECGPVRLTEPHMVPRAHASHPTFAPLLILPSRAGNSLQGNCEAHKHRFCIVLDTPIYLGFFFFPCF